MNRSGSLSTYIRMVAVVLVALSASGVTPAQAQETKNVSIFF